MSFFGPAFQKPTESHKELEEKADALITQRKYDEAIGLYSEAIKILEIKNVRYRNEKENIMLTEIYNKIGSTYKKQGKMVEAIRSYKKAQIIIDEKISPLYTSARSGINNLATTLEDYGIELKNNGNIEMAKIQFEEALQLYRRNLVNLKWLANSDWLANDIRNHYELINALGGLGSILLNLEKYADALPLYQEALERRVAILNPDDHRIGISHEGIGKALRGLGDYEEALSHFEEALRIYTINNKPQSKLDALQQIIDEVKIQRNSKLESDVKVNISSSNRIASLLGNTPPLAASFLNGLTRPEAGRISLSYLLNRRAKNRLDKHPYNFLPAFKIGYTCKLHTNNSGVRKIIIPNYDGWRMVTGAEWLNRQWQDAIVKQYRMQNGLPILDDIVISANYLELNDDSVALIDHAQVVPQRNGDMVTFINNATGNAWNSNIPHLGRNWAVYKIKNRTYKSHPGIALFVNQTLLELPEVEPLTFEEYSYNPNNVYQYSSKVDISRNKPFPAPWSKQKKSNVLFPPRHNAFQAPPRANAAGVTFSFGGPAAAPAAIPTVAAPTFSGVSGVRPAAPTFSGVSGVRPVAPTFSFSGPAAAAAAATPRAPTTFSFGGPAAAAAAATPGAPNTLSFRFANNTAPKSTVTRQLIPNNEKNGGFHKQTTCKRRTHHKRRTHRKYKTHRK